MTTETQLDVYNQALMLCEERTLSGLTEARKPRFLLDQVWNNGGVDACLEEGLWTFAMRTVAIVYNPNYQPAFGYIHGFDHPTDWKRTAALSNDPYFQSALTQVVDEASVWWCDLATLYVKYVSNDSNYGNNMTRWTEAFKQFMAAHFASKIVHSLTHDKAIQDRVMEERKRQLGSARGKDGMNEPPGFFPRGQLSRARQGMYYGRPNRSGFGWY